MGCHSLGKDRIQIRIYSEIKLKKGTLEKARLGFWRHETKQEAKQSYFTILPASHLFLV